MKTRTNITHMVGDIIERVGEMLVNMGAKRIGKKVYAAGDRIEHIKR